jgi:hypothetical protein
VDINRRFIKLPCAHLSSYTTQGARWAKIDR